VRAVTAMLRAALAIAVVALAGAALAPPAGPAARPTVLEGRGQAHPGDVGVLVRLGRPHRH